MQGVLSRSHLPYRPTVGVNNALKVCPDGSTLCVTCDAPDGVVLVPVPMGGREPHTSTRLLRFSKTNTLEAVAWSPDSSVLAVVMNSSVRLYRIHPIELELLWSQWLYYIPTDVDVTCTETKHGKQYWIAVAGPNGVEVYPYPNPEQHKAAQHAENFAMCSVRFSPDGRFLVEAALDGHHGIWQAYNAQWCPTRNSKCVWNQVLPTQERTTSLEFSPCGDLLAIGAWDRAIVLLRQRHVKDQVEWERFLPPELIMGMKDGHSAPGTYIVWSPNGRYVAFSDGEGYDLRVHEVHTGQRVWTWRQSSPIKGLCSVNSCLCILVCDRSMTLTVYRWPIRACLLSGALNGCCLASSPCAELIIRDKRIEWSQPCTVEVPECRRLLEVPFLPLERFLDACLWPSNANGSRSVPVALPACILPTAWPLVVQGGFSPNTGDILEQWMKGLDGGSVSAHNFSTQIDVVAVCVDPHNMALCLRDVAYLHSWGGERWNLVLADTPILAACLCRDELVLAHRGGVITIWHIGGVPRQIGHVHVSGECSWDIAASPQLVAVMDAQGHALSDFCVIEQVESQVASVCVYRIHRDTPTTLVLSSHVHLPEPYHHLVCRGSVGRVLLFSSLCGDRTETAPWWAALLGGRGPTVRLGTHDQTFVEILRDNRSLLCRLDDLE